MKKKQQPRYKWPEVLAHAIDLVESYDQAITLRQLFYRLVTDGTLENTKTSYKGLSRETAKARRAGEFPRLIDRTRGIDRAGSFDSPADARDWLRDVYRRNRTEGQKFNIYLGVEKDALAGLLTTWFGHLGVGIVPVRGYASQTLLDDIRDEVDGDDRPAIMFYGGDLDASGVDIPRDIAERLGDDVRVLRIALDAAQVARYGLPAAVGKNTDSRAEAFKLANGGKLVQVELDALPPDDLQRLYQDAIDGVWNPDAYADVMKREAAERETL